MSYVFAYSGVNDAESKESELSTLHPQLRALNLKETEWLGSNFFPQTYWIAIFEEPWISGGFICDRKLPLSILQSLTKYTNSRSTTPPVLKMLAWRVSPCYCFGEIERFKVISTGIYFTLNRSQFDIKKKHIWTIIDCAPFPLYFFFLERNAGTRPLRQRLCRIH